MRKVAVIALGLCLLASLGRACAPAERERLVGRLEFVESSGRPDCRGDYGTALGILQVRPIMVREANRIAGTTFTHEDMLDPAKAESVARIVLTYYDGVIERETGRPATTRELACVWRKGGDAWRRAETDPILVEYWRRVLRVPTT